MRYHVLALAVVLLFNSGDLKALPKLEEPVPLPATFNDIITIYPDNVQPKAYWIVPSIARIVKKSDGKLAFGLVHSGISSYDPDGVSALLTLTVQPYVDEPSLTKAKQLITMKNPGATFSYVSPTQMTCRLLIGGQYVDWDGHTQTVISGGIVEAGIPFQFKATNSFDVRALSQSLSKMGLHTRSRRIIRWIMATLTNASLLSVVRS